MQRAYHQDQNMCQEYKNNDQQCFGVMQQVNDSQMDQYYSQFFESGTICQFCKLSEQNLRCDIMMSQIKQKCSKNICIKCFDKQKDNLCQCGNKYKDHYLRDGKIRTSTKTKFYQYEKYFYKEQKIRKNQLFQHLDHDLINMLAYSHMYNVQHNHLSPSNRITYHHMDQKVKKILTDKRKQQERIYKQRSTKKKAAFVHREKLQFSGIDTCGYSFAFSKGIDLVFRSFGASQERYNQHENKKSQISLNKNKSTDDPQGIHTIKKSKQIPQVQKDITNL